jgi:TolA-binding protein
MKKTRPLLILTAFVSSILGGVVVYLMLSVPNDLRADALLKQARQDMRDGDNEKARQSLSKVVQQYPRTDAAAAATVALVSIGQKERDDLSRAIALLRRQNEQQTQILNTLQQNVTELRNAPPKTITVVQPAPQPAAPKAAPKKSPAPKKTTTKRSTRRSR